MLHPDPEDVNDEADEDIQEAGADGDQVDDEDGTFEDADEDTGCDGDNGHEEEPMEES